MARIRTIKPEFWTDEKTGTLSEFSKCLLIGLLNHSDDYGVIEFAPAQFRVKIFPYHSDTTTGAVNTALATELLPSGLVILFQIKNGADAGRQYLFVRNFDKHQVINKPSKPLLDGWEKGDVPKAYCSRIGAEYTEVGQEFASSAPAALPHHSGSTTHRKGKEGKGTEGSVEGRVAGDAPPPLVLTGQPDPVPKPARKKSKLPMPADFQLDDPMRRYAVERGFGEFEIARMFERFCSYHRSNANEYADWSQTWRTWVMKDVEFKEARSAKQQQSVSNEIPI